MHFALALYTASIYCGWPTQPTSKSDSHMHPKVLQPSIARAVLCQSSSARQLPSREVPQVPNRSAPSPGLCMLAGALTQPGMGWDVLQSSPARHGPHLLLASVHPIGCCYLAQPTCLLVPNHTDTFERYHIVWPDISPFLASLLPNRRCALEGELFKHPYCADTHHKSEVCHNFSNPFWHGLPSVLSFKYAKWGKSAAPTEVHKNQSGCESVGLDDSTHW